MDYNKAVKAYLAIREKRADIKRVYEDQDQDLKAKQIKIENALMKHLQENNTDSVKVMSGTFYKQEDLKPSASDWNAFYEWIGEHGAYDALERRIKKDFVKDFMEQHDGLLPPGVSVHREYVVRVRRA